MASLEQRGDSFPIAFRLGGSKFHVSTKMTDRRDAESSPISSNPNSTGGPGFEKNFDVSSAMLIHDSIVQNSIAFCCLPAEVQL